MGDLGEAPAPAELPRFGFVAVARERRVFDYPARAWGLLVAALSVVREAATGGCAFHDGRRGEALVGLFLVSRRGA